MKKEILTSEVSLNFNSDVKLSEDQKNLFNIAENTNNSLFITGGAGVGKSLFVDYFRNHTLKNVIVLGSTGVASINIKGQTIHSAFRLMPRVQVVDFNNKELWKIPNKVKTMIKNADVFLFDEISMTSPDVIDMVDQKCRLVMNSSLPFGGKQTIFIGDLLQLPPVIRDKSVFDYLIDHYGGIHFFNAPAFKDGKFKIYELTEIFRQQDMSFKEMLNNIRIGKISDDILEKINSRVDLPINEEEYIILTATNKTADDINKTKLDAIDNKEFTYHADITGDINENNFLVDTELHLKVGAQVMILSNDRKKRWGNGSLGIVTQLYPNEILVKINGKEYSIPKFTWHNYKNEYDEETKKIKQVKVGTLEQFPIRLGWALTIHKSQGKTFKTILIDLENGAFASGQVYVALSRCTSLDHLYLKKKINKRDIKVDNEALQFMKNMELSSISDDGAKVDYNYNIENIDIRKIK